MWTQAHDSDTGYNAQLMYSLTPQSQLVYAQQFSVDSLTGEVRIASPLDHEQASIIELNVCTCILQFMALGSFRVLEVGPLCTARGSGGALKLPQRVQAEPGRQTFTGAYRAENPASDELLS